MFLLIVLVISAGNLFIAIVVSLVLNIMQFPRLLIFTRNLRTDVCVHFCLLEIGFNKKY